MNRLPLTISRKVRTINLRLCYKILSALAKVYTGNRYIFMKAMFSKYYMNASFHECITESKYQVLAEVLFLSTKKSL